MSLSKTTRLSPAHSSSLILERDRKVEEYHEEDNDEGQHDNEVEDDDREVEEEEEEY